MSVLALRPPLALICLQDKIESPHCGYSALCHPQGPASVSSLILGADPFLMVHSALGTFTFSLFPKSNTFSVSDLSSCSYLWPLSHRGLGPLSSFRSRLREVSPSLPDNLCHFHQVLLSLPQSSSLEMPFSIGYLESVPFFLHSGAHSVPLASRLMAASHCGDVFRCQDCGLC